MLLGQLWLLLARFIKKEQMLFEMLEILVPFTNFRPWCLQDARQFSVLSREFFQHFSESPHEWIVRKSALSHWFKHSPLKLASTKQVYLESVMDFFLLSTIKNSAAFFYKAINLGSYKKPGKFWSRLLTQYSVVIGKK